MKFYDFDHSTHAPLPSGQIVLYQPDDSVSLEVKLDIDSDTVWLTQAQMCDLFQKAKSTISYHISKIFTEGELDKSVVVRKIRTTTQHGAIKDKMQTDDVMIYNLDVVISVGYRVKSKRGTQFRIWATNVLRDHLLKGYSINHQLIAMQERTDERFVQIEQQLSEQQQQVQFLVDIHKKPTEQIFPTGCVFDAWEYVSSLIRTAKKNIILIDNYCDERTLILLSKRADNVQCTIHTRYNEPFKEDLAKHNRQYPEILFVQLPHKAHDRFLIIDDAVYILGDSVKDFGHSLTTILRTMFQPEDILSKLR